MNRITAAQYAKGSSTVMPGSWTSLSDGQGGFSVPNVDYDLNGNIRHLNRQSIEEDMRTIDAMTYNYNDKGNQLTSVDDLAGNGGFKDDNTTGDDYDYAKLFY